MKEETIIFYTRKGLELVLLSKIIYCKAEGSYTTIKTNDKPIFVTKKIKEVEKMCCCNFLTRCHRSYIINVNFIDKIRNNNTIILTNKENVPIARRKLKELRKLIFNYYNHL